MDKELVVRDILSEQMIYAGDRLINRLDHSQSDVQAALWFFESDERIWKMILTSPLVTSIGPKKFYKRILDANKKADKSETVISLNDISVADSSNSLIRLLKSAMPDGNTIAGRRFSKNAINGTFIEDSYIYRI